MYSFNNYNDYLPLREDFRYDSQYFNFIFLFQVLQPQIDILNDEKIENHSKKSTKLSQNSTIKPVFETDRCNKDKDSFQNDEDLIPVENLTVIPMKQSSESRQNIIHQSFCGNKTKMNRTKDFDVEECCIAAFKVPLKPLRKFKTCIDYEHILKTTPIGKFCIFLFEPFFHYFFINLADFFLLFYPNKTASVA